MLLQAHELGAHRQELLQILHQIDTFDELAFNVAKATLNLCLISFAGIPIGGPAQQSYPARPEVVRQHAGHWPEAAGVIP